MLAVGLTALIALTVLLRVGPDTGPGRRLAEAAMDGMRAGRLGTIDVQGLRGDIWSDFSVRRLSIRDGAGEWLSARKVRVRWRPGELLFRRVHVTSASADDVIILRRPILSAPVTPGPSPVSIRLDRSRLRLETAPAFSQVRGDFTVIGDLQTSRSGLKQARVEASSRIHRGDFLRGRLVIGKGDRFSLSALAVEARGGALAGSLGLPPRLPFRLALDAYGGPAAGTFSLDTRVGASAPAQGSGAWGPGGGTAHGWISLAASGLLAPYQRLLGPVAAVAIRWGPPKRNFADLQIALVSRNLDLTGWGLADPARFETGAAGLALTARMNDAGPLIGLAKAGPLMARLGLGGAPRRWALTGSLSLRDLAADGYALASLSGPLQLQGEGAQVRFELAAQGAGGVGKGTAAALLGARPAAQVTGTRLADGRLLFQSVDVHGSGLGLSAQGRTGVFGSLDFQGAAALSELGSVRAGARGAILAYWRAENSGPGRPWSFSFSARGKGLATGSPQVDRLLGGSPRLDVKGGYGGGWTLDRVDLVGAAGALNAAGLIDEHGALRIKVEWSAKGPFEAGPFEIAGALRGTGALTGTLPAPQADLNARFASLNAPGLALGQGSLLVRVGTAPHGTAGVVVLGAASRWGAAKARAEFQLTNGGATLSGLDAEAGGLRVSGTVSLTDGAPPRADLTVGIGPGAFLDSGRVTGRMHVANLGRQTDVTIDLRADTAVLGGGALAIDSGRFQGDGPIDRIAYRLRARGVLRPQGGWRMAGQGDVVASGASRTLSFMGSGAVGAMPLKTLSPVRLRIAAGTLSANGAIEIAGASGAFSVAQSGSSIRGRVQLADLALGKVSSEVRGRLDGAMNFEGRAGTLSGAFQANLAGLTMRGTADVAPIGGVIRGRLAGRTLALHAALTSGRDLRAGGTLSLPVDVSAAPLHLAVDRRSVMKGQFLLQGDVSPIWTLLMGADRSLTGRIAAAGSLAGTLADPRALGVVSLDHGRFEDSQTGLEMAGVTLRAQLTGNAVNVQTFSASDDHSGSLSGVGQISLERNGVSSFRLDLNRFRLIDNETAQADASGRATINRAVDGRVQLIGALTLDDALIAPNPPVPTGVVPMEVVEIHRPAGRGSADAQSSPSPIALKVDISAARGVFVKGRGLDVELAVAAVVRGTTTDPLLSGSARVVRGDYDFAGKRFLFDDHSVVHLASRAEDIRLDLTATREDPALTAVVNISGTAARPKVTLSSTPALPSDEILSQVLFGASAARLSPFQAAQLASAVAGLRGGGGLDVLGGLRNLAHLDRLALGTNSAGSSTISGGKYLNDNVYVELIGSRDGPSAQVEWRVKKNVSLVSRVGRAGDSQLSIRWRRDY